MCGHSHCYFGKLSQILGWIWGGGYGIGTVPVTKGREEPEELSGYTIYMAVVVHAQAWRAFRPNKVL